MAKWTMQRIERTQDAMGGPFIIVTLATHDRHPESSGHLLEMGREVASLLSAGPKLLALRAEAERSRAALRKTMEGVSLLLEGRESEDVAALVYSWWGLTADGEVAR